MIKRIIVAGYLAVAMVALSTIVYNHRPHQNTKTQNQPFEGAIKLKHSGTIGV